MGYRGSGFMWGEEFITLLSRSLQVIYFDNRGTGLSDKPDTLYTIPIMADDADSSGTLVSVRPTVYLWAG